ncbi:hypothetical protein Acr_00g0021090 [Actinidia rufa]|uniref:Uncharacterized protein n=1 Tax=Actinidia rufa TaxID=165716 RepID=A0A7J0DC67_9ERIC|nr:hypothetical protein Acr_00g0021090 [Actinidia rufa]
MLIAGPALWLLGPIHNGCQIYERADGHVQMLQESVHVPFLTGSLLFLVGAVLNGREQAGRSHHGLELLLIGLCWGINECGESVQDATEQRNAAREIARRSARAIGSEREGQVSLILEEQRRRKQVEEVKSAVAATAAAAPTPYKDVLVGPS